jgi:hypothetical protein
LEVGNAMSVTIGGSIVASDFSNGDFTHDGYVDGQAIGSFTLGGSIVGGAGENSGVVFFNSAKSVTIKGSIIGGLQTVATKNRAAGALDVGGALGSLTIGGDLVAGTFGTGTQLGYNGAVIVGGNLGSATIKGSIIGHDGQQAILIAGGTAPVGPVKNYNAIGKLTIGGDVTYAYIAAGQTEDLSSQYARRIDAAENSDAGVGSVTVGGKWLHSNLSAGINDTNTNGLTAADTRDAGTAAKAVIGPIVIKGYVLDDPTASGFSGFIGEKIVSLTAGGVKLFKSGDTSRFLDSSQFVIAKET